jgi:hypothetical protein
VLLEDTFDLWLYTTVGSAQVIYGDASEKFLMTTFGLAGGITASGGVFEWVAKLGDTSASFLRASTVMESTGSGGDQLGGTCTTYLTSSDLSDSSNPLLAGGFLRSLDFDHRIDATDNATAWHEGIRFVSQIPNSGSPGGVADVGSSVVGVIITVPESTSPSDGLYHNNDGTFAFGRWAIYVEQGETHLRRTEFTSTLDLGKALVRFDQNDDNAPFHELEGRHDNNPVTPNCNLADNDTGGVVVGPKANDWSWLGMYQVYVIDVSGHIASGHYWVPLYEAI